MSTELFPDLPESPSPKLAWMRKHGLATHFDGGLAACPESPETGDTCFPWICSQAKSASLLFSSEIQRVGVGTTEDEAIIDFCRKNDVTHYSLK